MRVNQMPRKQIGEITFPGEVSRATSVRACVCAGVGRWSKGTALRAEGGQALTKGRKKKRSEQEEGFTQK